mmetsp:Transcript_10920/g.25324  ORF Transcript_10920/g.25324 Transcript_10920/m.25324 type:complete len:177 (-) Transcript_10920:374-904(-)
MQVDHLLSTELLVVQNRNTTLLRRTGVAGHPLSAPTCVSMQVLRLQPHVHRVQQGHSTRGPNPRQSDPNDSRLCMETKSHISLGISPRKSLNCRNSFVNAVNSPSSDGIAAVNSLLLMDNSRRLLHCESSVGMGPVKSFCCNTIRASQRARMYMTVCERSPLREDSRRHKHVRTDG